MGLGLEAPSGLHSTTEPLILPWIMGFRIFLVSTLLGKKFNPA